MINFYDFILQNPDFKKLELDELVLIEYKCPIDVEVLPVWTPHDALVHCLSGKKTWKTWDQTITITENQTLFIAKGAQIVYQSFESEFCLLMVFIKDAFKERLRTQPLTLDHTATQNTAHFTMHPVRNNPALHSYYLSIFSYLQQAAPPTAVLMELKLVELVHLLAHQQENLPIVRYLVQLNDDPVKTLKAIMEDNYMYNLSLADYARLCNRSLSSFKRDFQKCFGIPPGKWLANQRLRRAASMLRNTTEPVTQVAFDCGFEDASHFSKAFKKFFHQTPLTYRKQD